MAFWHFYFGIGIGVFATVLTAIITSRQRSIKQTAPFTSPSDEPCMICRYPLSDDEVVLLPCCHPIHQKCLIDLRKKIRAKECPICRQPIV